MSAILLLFDQNETSIGGIAMLKKGIVLFGFYYTVCKHGVGVLKILTSNKNITECLESLEKHHSAL